MTAPRIDTVRNTTHQTIHRLAHALELLQDLHTLGYYRHADHRARQRVTGGDPTAIGIDLDNHGDPRYRTAYEHLAQTLLTVNDHLAQPITAAEALFATGRISTRRDTTADATTPEIINALGRQASRRAQGDHSPTPIVTQPLPSQSRQLLDLSQLQEELDALRNAARKTGLKADRGRFTPREQDAWRRATGTETTRRKRSR